MASIAPNDLTYLFLAISFSAAILFYRACRSITFLVISAAWCAIQVLVSLTGFYAQTESLPPRLLLGIVPTLAFIVVVFATPRGRRFVDELSIEKLTWFHVVRIPVEFTLTALYHIELISVWQTMEGTNFDLLSGLSAPLIGWYAFRHGNIRRRLLLWWNCICLVLLFNVVITSIFAMPGPLQQISFHGRYFAVLHFPFVLLPTYIVPLVLFAHLAAIRSLMRRGK